MKKRFFIYFFISLVFIIIWLILKINIFNNQENILIFNGFYFIIKNTIFLIGSSGYIVEKEKKCKNLVMETTDSTYQYKCIYLI